MMRQADTPRLLALFPAIALILAATIGGCAPRTAEIRTCHSRSDRSTCLEDPANCPCEAYGDCGMEGCARRGGEVAAARDAEARRAAVLQAAPPESEGSAAVGGSAPACASPEDRATCGADPAACPCEAYGDCSMPGCLARGAEVQAARDAAPSAAPTSAPAAATASSPAAAAASTSTSTTPPVSVHASTPSPATPASGSSCRTAADRNQCSEEPYWCPCDAYGDCGMECCREPQSRPPAVGCSTEDDRSVCRTDPARCPCPVGGACGMPGCS